MKPWIFALIGLIIISCSGNAATKVKSENLAKAEARQEASDSLPVLTFDKKTHDFGTINEGDVVETAFSFTNTGSSDLTILDARGSCGCTVPEYPKNTPIKPGETKEIKVKFEPKFCFVVRGFFSFYNPFLLVLFYKVSVFGN